MDGLMFFFFTLLILFLLSVGLWFIWLDPKIEIEHDEHRDAGVG